MSVESLNHSHSSQLIKYFENIEGVHEIKDGYNPATWMLEVTTLAQEESLGVNFSEVYKTSELYRKRNQDLFNAMGSMYASVLFIGVQNASSVQPVVSIERTVFYREKAAGMYSALPYAFGQVAIEIPYIFVQAVVYGIIVYAMIGFEWTAAKFFWYIFFRYFTLLYFTFYGMMTVGLTPNYQVASIVSASFYSLWNLFSGFLTPRPRWYVWICPVAWTLYGLVSSQFGDVQNTIEGGQTVAEFVRSYFRFHHNFLGVVAVVVVAFAVLFAFLFGFAIQKFNFQKR